jgi:kynurenine formamidase
MTAEINNWGRWGEDDQLGQLNLMTPERILAALQLVKKGKLYNLAVPLEKDGPQAPLFHKTLQLTYYTSDQRPGASNMADDFVAMETHSGTHMDSLGHFSRDGRLWNGRSAENVTSRGLDWAGIENVKGFVARGVLLDLPAYKGVPHLGLGELVTPEDMDACAAAQGVEIRVGDILLLRTGWYRVFREQRALYDQGEPGPDATCTAWLKAKDVIAIGADNYGVERMMIKDRNPLNPRLHTTALRDLGVYLIENLDLEELARDRAYEFLFVAAPLRMTKATGAPFSPIALV